MQEAQNKKKNERQEGLHRDAEDLDEFYRYAPFGRGGAGAPLRDQHGNIISTRKPNFRQDWQRQHDFRPKEMSVAAKSKRRGMTAFGRSGSKGDGVRYDYHVAEAAPKPDDFQPDYIVETKPEPKKEPEPEEYPVYAPAPPPPPKTEVVYDYSVWLTELLNLLYYERLAREDEDRRRREAMLLEEERLRREKEDLDRRYQRELDDRQRAYETMQDDNLHALETFWEKLHDEETRKWETLMSTKPMVQYVERDDTLKLGQSLVDHLQHTLRTELTKVKNDIDLQEVDL